MADDLSRKVDHPFLRQVEVLIGPLPEWKGGGQEKNAMRLYGDGTTNNLRIKFQVNSPMAPCSVHVYNLSQATRDALQVDNAQMVINAGWMNLGMINIFKGTLLASKSERHGADIVTELMAMSGWHGANQNVVIETHAGGTQVRDIVLSNARQIPGITVDNFNVNIMPKSIGSGGLSLADTPAENLTKLAKVYGFTWWLEDKIFFACDDNTSFSVGTIPLISGKNGFLLRAEPMISPGATAWTGISVWSLFNPFIRFFNDFQLESTVNPKINGIRKAHQIHHIGDTHSNQWNTEILSFNKIGVNISSTATTADAIDLSDLDIVAGTIYGEAAGENEKGKIAVGLTIRERVQHPGYNGWGADWRSVCTKPSQFNCWMADRSFKIYQAQQAKNSNWNLCVKVAQDIMAGKYFDVGLSGIPTNFFNPNAANPKWAKTFRYIGTIGGHSFYRDPGIK